MSSKSIALAFPRFLLACLAMTTVTTVLYSAASFGFTVGRAQLVMIGAFALLVSFLVAVPISLIGTRMRWRRIGFSALFFVVIFSAFFAWNMLSMLDATQLVVAARTLVADGEVTEFGYWVAVRDSAITALVCLAGFVVFLLVAPLRHLSPHK